MEEDEVDRFFDAIRLLLLIVAVSDPLNEAEQQAAPKDAVAVLRAEGRLQKLDFWLRNPDYLADELLNDYEREQETINLELAGSILDSDEPEICAVPMLRYLFGAFGYIDQAMSILAAPRLVLVVPRRTAKRVLQDNYYLTAKGREGADRATEQFPVLAWYTEPVARATATGRAPAVLRRHQDRHGRQQRCLHRRHDAGPRPVGHRQHHEQRRQVEPPLGAQLRAARGRLRNLQTTGNGGLVLLRPRGHRGRRRRQLTQVNTARKKDTQESNRVQRRAREDAQAREQQTEPLRQALRAAEEKVAALEAGQPDLRPARRGRRRRTSARARPSGSPGG
ncbi:hypothetical protein [Streptomyces sp.]|uniref:hypothetical protein n=1 Tax=Streptomyces sp. TaxID=1931 RepID=UPI002F948F86